MEAWNEDLSASADARRSPVRGTVPPSDGTRESEAARSERMAATALSGLATYTLRAEPREDFEETLLARAEAEGLLVTAPPAKVRRREGGRAGRVARVPRWAWGSLAAAAAALVVWLGMGLWQPADLPTRPSPQQAGLTPQQEPAPASGIEPPPSAAMQANASVRSTASRNARVRQPASASRPRQKPLRVIRSVQPEMLTVAAQPVVEPAREPLVRYSGFVPLSSTPPLRAEEIAQTVRVRVGADDFWRLGLPVTPVGQGGRLAPDDRIFADFLVGDDGRPRAVRLVSIEE